MECKTCNGTGFITRYGQDSHDKFKCPACNGQAYVRKEPVKEESLEALEEAARNIQSEIQGLESRLKSVKNKIYWIKNPQGDF